MGPVDWLAVIVAAGLAAGIGIVWHSLLFRTGRNPHESPQARNWGLTLAVFLFAAAMLGHNYARIGVATLSAKPWLYFMQAGGLAIAFVVPAIWLTHARNGTPARERLVDAGFWLIAYLAMGAVFWALGDADSARQIIAR